MPRIKFSLEKKKINFWFCDRVSVFATLYITKNDESYFKCGIPRFGTEYLSNKWKNILQTIYLYLNTGLKDFINYGFFAFVVYTWRFADQHNTVWIWHIQVSFFSKIRVQLSVWMWLMLVKKNSKKFFEFAFVVEMRMVLNIPKIRMIEIFML